MSRQMTRWEEVVKNPKQKEYSVEVMQKVGDAMQADLNRRFTRPRVVTNGMTAEKRSYVFKFEPLVKEFFLTTLTPDVYAFNAA